ncbi:MAG: alpha/beta hydrolase [Ignavibacteriales bacterium]|nr:alpha/beta hydrolase [Ignavibacteriales bacterium]
MEFDSLQYLFPVIKTQIEPGLTIVHTDMGDGEPVVFIHGLGSYIPAWNKNLTTLSKHLRCIAIDLPGYGKSSKSLHTGTMDFYAELVIKLMDKLGIGKFNICGHSMGGVIAFKLAIEFPDRVNKLFLSAPGGAEIYSDDEKLLVENFISTERMINNDDNQIRNNVLVNFHIFPDDAWFMISDRIAIRKAGEFAAHAEIIARSASGVINSDVPFRLSEVKSKTMIIFGDNDKLIPNRFVHPELTPEEMINIFRLNIRSLHIKIYPDCGHFPQFESPNQFNRDLLNFIL